MKCGYAILASMLCLSFGLSGCSGNDKVEESKGIAVETQIAVKGEIETDYVYSGKIVAANAVNIFPMAQGNVKEINVKIGDSVKAGDVLFTIDTESLEITLKQLQASLQAADAGVAQAQAAYNMVDGAAFQMNVESLKGNVETARKNYENMEKTFENSKILYENGVIAKTEFDNIELGYIQAKTAYETASKSLELTTGQMLEENKAQAQAGLSAAAAQRDGLKAQIESVEKSLRDATVTAPIDGKVTALNVTAGEMLSTAQIPAAVTDASKLKIKVSVSQRIINSVESGDKVSIKTEALSEIIEGKVSTVNPAANMSGTYDIEIEIDNKDDKLKSGMFAEVTFTNEKGSEEIVVDRNVIVTKNGETYVFVDDNGLAVKKMVETGIDDGISIQITDGIEEGEMLVTKGQSYLKEGDKLNVVNAVSEENTDSSEEKGE